MFTFTLYHTPSVFEALLVQIMAILPLEQKPVFHLPGTTPPPTPQTWGLRESPASHFRNPGCLLFTKG